MYKTVPFLRFVTSNHHRHRSAFFVSAIGCEKEITNENDYRLHRVNTIIITTTTTTILLLLLLISIDWDIHIHISAYSNFGFLLGSTDLFEQLNEFGFVHLSS